MKQLDKFIIKSFIGPFIAILLVVVFVLMMQFLWLYIDELVGKGLGLKVILEFLGWGCATLLPLALPLATLLASMMIMGTLTENNELLAIKAAGISLQRIMVPIGVLCAIISVAAYFVSNDLLPIAYNKIYTLRDDISKTKEEIKIPSGTFYDGIDGYILRVEDRDKESGMMYGVMVYNHTGNSGNTSLTLADSAILKMSKEKTYLSFTLYNGSNYEETNTKKYRDTTLQLQKVDFTRQELLIPLQNYSFEKSDSSRFGDQVKSMNLKQLHHGQDSIGAINSDAKVENSDVFRKSRTLKYNTQLDTAETKVLTSRFEPKDEDVVWDNTTDEINAYERAKRAAEDLKNSVNGFTRERYHNLFMLRLIDIEILKKFALSIACFIFFFIGAPIGSLIRKGGLGTPAIISVLFFVLYWVVDISGSKLARDGATDPFTGVFISAYVLIPIGAWLTWMAVNDHSFNMDKAKETFRKYKSKVFSLFKKTRIVYMGTPDFAVAPLEELLKKGYKVVGVVTVADKASGRGLKINESPVKKFAVEHNIPVLQPISLKDPEFISELKSWKPDLFVVVAFRMLPKVVWEIPSLGTFNLHAALLPQYRGAAPINWAVINGERTTGVTTFMINDGMDTGQIFFREPCPITPTDTAGDVHDKLMFLGSELVARTVEAIIEGNYKLRHQKTFIQGQEILKPAPKLTKELCHICWNDTSVNIYNLIRGLSPYPAAFTELVKDNKATVMKIYESKIADKDTLNRILNENNLTERPEAGKILSDNRTYMAITTKDGAILLNEIQISGKKKMNVKDFLIGFRDCQSYSTNNGPDKNL